MRLLGDKPLALTWQAAKSRPGLEPTLKHLLRALFLPLLIAPIQATAAELLYDSHIHYSANAHAEVPPERALALLEEAGITRAMVSSTPDDGTLALYRLDPERIVPVLRPYRDRGDMSGWHHDPAVIAYIEARLAATDAYRGLGEFHVDADDVGSPEMARLIDLARAQRLFLHVHTDGAGIEALIAVAPGVRILWAHAGLGEPITTVDAVLSRHPRLMADLSYRYGDILRGSALDPAWHDLLRRHADRFLLASDTWAPSRWPQLPAITTQARAIMTALPAGVAAKLAHGNFEALLAR